MEPVRIGNSPLRPSLPLVAGCVFGRISAATTGEQQAAFMDPRGPTVWNDGNLAAWADLGAEQAAEILLWGITGKTSNIDFLGQG